MTYEEFLRRKVQYGARSGFKPLWMPGFLFGFQAFLDEWAIEQGRGAIFAGTGQGKTPMQLVWAQNVVQHANKPVLILTPLAVAPQTVREAEKFGIEARRSPDGVVRPGINVTNYERLHYFKPEDFAGVVADESACLKALDGVRRKAVTEFLRTVPYRLLCSATPAPNDYVELGTSSEALGELGLMDMLGRFFVNDQKSCDTKGRYRGWGAPRSYNGPGWRFKGHAEGPFWQWVCSWARACRKPSDLGFPDDGFILPPLTEREHIIEAKTLAPGKLFVMPARGLREEREERRRTLRERCEKVAELVEDHDYSVIWCHYNKEGDLLEEMIPNALQVKGDDSDDYRELVADWFCGHRCICNEPAVAAKLAAWRRGLLDTGKNSIERIVRNASAKPASGNESIERSGCSTCEGTIEKTERSGSSTMPSGNGGAKSDGTDMLPIPSTEPRASRRRKKPASGIPTHGSGDASADMDSLLTTITDSPRTDALFAEQQKTRATSGSNASFSTTATRRENSEDCSAQIVTLDSESSKTVLKLLSEQRCICGHSGNGPRRLIAKPVMFGWGLNLQHCAHVVTFASHSYEAYFQSIRRCYRFGQKREVVVDVVATGGEAGIRENLRRKSEAAEHMLSELVAHMNDALRIQRGQSFGQAVEVPTWLA